MINMSKISQYIKKKLTNQVNLKKRGDYDNI